MTIASDIVNRLSDDMQYDSSGFYTAVFSYGAGIIQLLEDAGYQPAGPDGKVYIEIEAALGSAEVYVEGQAMPAPIESTTLEAAFTPKSFRGVVRMSGHERRKIGDNQQGARVKVGGSAAGYKVMRATNRIRDLMAKTFDDADTYGLQGQISQTTAFGDQSRSTYTALRAYLCQASGAAPSTSLLNKAVATGADTPYGAKPDVWLSGPLQAGKVMELVSGKLSVPSITGSTELIPTGVSIGGAPLLILPNLGTSTIYGLSGAGGGPRQPTAMPFSDAENYQSSRTWRVKWHEEAPGRFHVLDLGANNADIPLNLQISTMLTMYHVNPSQQVLISGLTTA